MSYPIGNVQKIIRLDDINVIISAKVYYELSSITEGDFYFPGFWFDKSYDICVRITITSGGEDENGKYAIVTVKPLTPNVVLRQSVLEIMFLQQLPS